MDEGFLADFARLELRDSAFRDVFHQLGLLLDSQMMRLFLCFLQHRIKYIKTIEHALNRLTQVLKRRLIIQISHKAMRFSVDFDVVE